jgi:hypothetical protein
MLFSRWWLTYLEFGSVQETQRLLSEPGAWLLLRANFSENFGAIRSLSHCSILHTLRVLQCHDPWPHAVTL